MSVTDKCGYVAHAHVRIFKISAAGESDNRQEGEARAVASGPCPFRVCAQTALSLSQLTHTSDFPRVSWVILSKLKDGTVFRVVLMLCMNNLEKVHGLLIYT